MSALVALLSVGLVACGNEHETVVVQDNYVIDTPEGPVLVGPGPGEQSPGPSAVGMPDRPSDQDITTLTMIYMYSLGSLRMASVALENPGASQRLRDHATAVVAARTAGINDVQRMLSGWGVELPDASDLSDPNAHMPKSPHGEDLADLNALATLSGEELDREWVEQFTSRALTADKMADDILANADGVLVRRFATEMKKAVNTYLTQLALWKFEE